MASRSRALNSLAAPRLPALLRRDVSSLHRQALVDRSTEPLAPSEIGLASQTVALVLFSAWAFGGSVEWAQPWIVALSAVGLFTLAARRREVGRIAWQPFLPALLWGAFAAVALLNPSHAPMSDGGWAERAGWLRWLPATVDRPRTWVDVALWMPALLQAGVIIAVLRSTRAASVIWATVALNGCALAVVGAGFHFLGTERLLGLVEGEEPTYFFATFFYKNHWAAYGALSAGAAFTLALSAQRAAQAGDARAHGRMLLFSAAGLLTAVTLPLPGSRAGALLAFVMIAGFAIALLVTWGRAAPRRRNGLPLAAILLASALVLTIGWRAYAARAAKDLTRTRAQVSGSIQGEWLDIRLPVSRDTWRMTLQRPWFGWGPGCFDIVFPVFQGSDLRGPDGRPRLRFEKAHNDWLQLTAENGFVGAALLLVPVGVFVRRAWRPSGFSGRCGLIICGLIAAYAWIDFPLHNRAVLLLWAVLLASAPRLALSTTAPS